MISIIIINKKGKMDLISEYANTRYTAMAVCGIIVFLTELFSLLAVRLSSDNS